MILLLIEMLPLLEADPALPSLKRQICQPAEGKLISTKSSVKKKKRVQWANESCLGLRHREVLIKQSEKANAQEESNRRKRAAPREEARVWVSLTRAGSTLISSGVAGSREKGICHCTVRMEWRSVWLLWIMAGVRVRELKEINRKYN